MRNLRRGSDVILYDYHLAWSCFVAVRFCCKRGGYRECTTHTCIFIQSLVLWKYLKQSFFPLQELNDVPLYVSLHSMSATLKCTPPSATLFRSAVVNAGYRISGSHANPLGLKTDAPMEALWDIMRCWVGFINLSLSFIKGPIVCCRKWCMNRL